MSFLLFPSSLLIVSREIHLKTKKLLPLASHSPGYLTDTRFRNINCLSSGASSHASLRPENYCSRERRFTLFKTVCNLIKRRPPRPTRFRDEHTRTFDSVFAYIDRVPCPCHGFRKLRSRGGLLTGLFTVKLLPPYTVNTGGRSTRPAPDSSIRSIVRCCSFVLALFRKGF